MSTKTKWSEVADQGSELGISSSGGFLTLEDGENIVRILSEPVHFTQYFIAKGLKPVYEENASEEIKATKRPTHRFACYVYNQKEKALQIAEFGWSIVKAVGELSSSSQYGYKGVPPFDLIINKSGTGLKTDYTVHAGRNEDPLPANIIDELSKKQDIAEWLDEKIATQAGEENPNATEEDMDTVSQNTKKN